MLKPAVEPHLARQAGESGEFCEADDKGADYFRDVGLHRQLTVEMDAKITNGSRATPSTVTPGGKKFN